jgi:hypothetical protein
MARTPKQLALPFPAEPTPAAARLLAADRLRLWLEARLGEAVHLTVTDNRHTMISVRRRPDGVHALRVHHMFLGADAGLVKHLARYLLQRDARSSREIGRFIASQQHLLREGEARRRPPLLRTRGRYHDLQEIYGEINRRHFEGAVGARITWAVVRSGRRRSSIKLGTYSVEDRLIRIHPVLDQAFVPRRFIEWIVYHEMLHDAVGVRVVDGRRLFHSPEFRLRERAFEHYAEARQWEGENLDRLLRGIRK